MHSSGVDLSLIIFTRHDETLIVLMKEMQTYLMDLVNLDALIYLVYHSPKGDRIQVPSVESK